MPSDRRRRGAAATALVAAMTATIATATVATPTAAGLAPGAAAEPGTITGHVLQTGHTISPGIDVSLYTAGGTFVDHTVSDGYGDFAFGGLEPGSYAIEFENQHEAVLEWYDNASTLDGATPIAVDSGATATVDAYLTRASENVDAPTVTGSATVGSRLTATTGSWFPAPQSFAYAWLRGTSPIAGATGPTYAVTAADAGQRISVRVTATASGYTESATSAAVGPVPGEAVEEPTQVAGVTPPVVTGTARVGSTVTASGDTWSPASVSRSYQWLRGGTPIPGATAATYAVTADDAGRTLQVRVTAASGSLEPAVVTSAPTEPVARATSRLTAAVSGLRRAARVTVRVTTAGTGTGKVTLSLTGRGRTATRTLTLRNRTATVKVPRLRAGRYAVSAAYAGDTASMPARARTVVRVRP